MKWRDIRKAYDKLHIELKPGKHFRGWFEFGGRKQWPVQMSHKRGEVPGKVPDKISTQLNLSMAELRQLIDCTIDHDEYVQLMRARGFLT